VSTSAYLSPHTFPSICIGKQEKRSPRIQTGFEGGRSVVVKKDDSKKAWPLHIYFPHKACLSKQPISTLNHANPWMPDKVCGMRIGPTKLETPPSPLTRNSYSLLQNKATLYSLLNKRTRIDKVYPIETIFGQIKTFHDKEKIK
jgi:hypothetical protein